MLNKFSPFVAGFIVGFFITAVFEGKRKQDSPTGEEISALRLEIGFLKQRAEGQERICRILENQLAAGQ